MAVGIYDWALIADHQQEKLYVISPKDHPRLAWLQAQKKRHDAEALTNNTSQDNRFLLTSPWQANMDKATYCNKFDRVQNYLLSGDCYQINLAQRFSALYQGDEWHAYRLLEDSNQAPFSAFIRTEDSSVLSVSPERFLQHRHGWWKPSRSKEHDHAALTL